MTVQSLNKTAWLQQLAQVYVSSRKLKMGLLRKFDHKEAHDYHFEPEF